MRGGEALHLYSVGLYTLGCKVSQYETEAVGELFESMGFERKDFFEPCDVYVINTCTVTAESDAKSRKFIRRAAKTNPSAVICVMGCYSQRAMDDVRKIDGVSVAVGTENKTRLPHIALEILTGRMKEHYSVTDVRCAEFEQMSISRAPRTRAYVKIEDGCECRCTYCAISDARGRVRSKKPQDVIKEVEALHASGVREVVLTGIETSSYGADFDTGYRLADLLRELDARGSCDRIRLGSLAPELLDEGFAKCVADLKILAPHFHISVQSASNSVLHAMKRRYGAQMLYANIERMQKYIPNAVFTADLMVGFPGESEEDFLRTFEFVSRARLIDAHVFAYSVRKGTPAATFPNQVPEDVKHSRSERLISEVLRVREGVLDSIVKGKDELVCILEARRGEVFTAHSDEFAEVHATGAGYGHGDLVRVAPVSHKDGIIFGNILGYVN